MGFDPTSQSDVANLFQVWGLKNNNRYAGGQVAQDAISNSRGNVGTGHIIGTRQSFEERILTAKTLEELTACEQEME